MEIIFLINNFKFDNNKKCPHLIIFIKFTNRDLMVFQVTGSILFPIVLLIVAAASFDGSIEVQPTEPD